MLMWVTWADWTNSQTLTSSISLIHLSMPSKDHLLVMSYTSRIPWSETNDVSVQTPAAFKWMQLFAPHLSSTGVRAKDGAEPPLSRGVPEEKQHIKQSGLCSCKQINPSSAFGVNGTKAAGFSQQDGNLSRLLFGGFRFSRASDGPPNWGKNMQLNPLHPSIDNTFSLLALWPKPSMNCCKCHKFISKCATWSKIRVLWSLVVSRFKYFL